VLEAVPAVEWKAESGLIDIQTIITTKCQLVDINEDLQDVDA
jgi:hypothetical protein